VGSGNVSVVSKDALLPGFAEIPAKGRGWEPRGYTPQVEDGIPENGGSKRNHCAIFRFHVKPLRG